jgi:hypothetical protein
MSPLIHAAVASSPYQVIVRYWRNVQRPSDDAVNDAWRVQAGIEKGTFLVYPARGGGPWLWRILVRSGFQAVVVPSGFSTKVQPQR